MEAVAAQCEALSRSSGMDLRTGLAVISHEISVEKAEA